jgi:GNAT superfamily N-acetyltransferase
MLQPIAIRAGTRREAVAVCSLYRATAGPGIGLARERDEISQTYVDEFIEKSLSDGVFLVTEIRGHPGLAGEIHAYRNGLKRFSHVLGSLAVAVHPAAQGCGVGRQLFGSLVAHVIGHMPDIERIELITQESHVKAIALYESMGFRREGRLEHGIRSSDGCFEADIPMGWLRSRMLGKIADGRPEHND